MQVECPNCPRNKFDSKHDAKIHHAHVHNESIEKITYAVCGICYRRVWKFDSENNTYSSCECSEKRQTWLTLDDEYDPGPLREKDREMIREALGNKCQGCPRTRDDVDRKLAVAHIDQDTYNNSPWNLTVLCSWCHALLDTPSCDMNIDDLDNVLAEVTSESWAQNLP